MYIDKGELNFNECELYLNKNIFGLKKSHM